VVAKVVTIRQRPGTIAATTSCPSSRPPSATHSTRIFAERPTLDTIGVKTRRRLLDSAAADIAVLWPHVEDEAESLVHDVRQAKRAQRP
jgi:hypothetical protein